MPNPQFSRSDLTNDVNDMIKGSMSSTTQQDRIFERAIRDVISDIDFYSTKRRVPLSIDGANAVYSETTDGTYDSDVRSDILEEEDDYFFHCPTDLKGNAVVDIRKRYDKGFDPFCLTTPEEFLRKKSYSEEMVALDVNQFSMKKLMVSGIEDIDTEMIHNCDTYDGDGTWAADGAQITAVATETSNYVEGIGAIGFTTVTGAIAGGTLTVSDMTAVDISDYEDHSVYVWVYIPMATDLTSFTLKWGSSSAAYFSRTVTKTHDGVSFFVGWNLLRFPWADATETGTVVETAIDYLQLTVIKGASNTGTTGWIMDRIIAQEDSEFDVIYYTDHPWQNTSGVYLMESTSDTDLLNADLTEYNLYVLKAAQYCSGFLDEERGEEKYRAEYEKRKQDYISQHPSERMNLTTSYQDLESLEGNINDSIND